MSKGIDCAKPLTAETAAAFKADGYAFVGRYALPEGSWKALTADEVKIISDAGLHIISIWETTADRALGGFEAGQEDGQAAIEVAKGLGQPTGTPIYFAVDFDAMGDQFDAIEAYMQAAKHELGFAGYMLGIYGSYSVVETMASRNVSMYFWQTVAWSHKLRSSIAQLFQSDIDQTEHGIGVDHNESNGSAGGWKLEAPVPVPESVDKELAKAIIEDLGAAWNVTKSDDIKNKLHDIANAVRKLAGLEEGQ